jgi:hypothetical protein
MGRKSWIQINGKLIPKDEYYGNNSRADLPHILPDIEPFKSPITGEVIRGRGHLRQHMKEHGVTNIGDYSADYFQKKQIERSRQITGQTKEARAERIALLKQAMER